MMHTVRPARAAAWLAVLAALSSGVQGQDAKGGPIEIETVKLDRPADFVQDVLPILRSKCLACHNTKTAEADLVLETRDTILKGGESGPAVTAGKGEESLLIKAGSQRKKPHMPPKDNKVGAKPLTPRELGVIKLWIDQGAKASMVKAAEGPLLRPAPANWNPIYAVALDPEGQYAACGRAGKLFLYHLPTRTLVDRPASDKEGLADRDSVQSIAFSPDGMLLATGGYRSIKLWQKEVPEKKFQLDLGGEPKVAALSADAARLAVTGGDPSIKVFDLASGKAVAEMKGHSDAVTSLRFSADGTLLVSASADKSVRLWKADGSAVGKIDTSCVAAAFLSDGKQIATGGTDAVIRLWALPEADKESKPIKEIKGKEPVADLRAAGAGLITTTPDGKIQHWNLETGVAGRSLAAGGAVSGISVSADGKRILALAGTTAKLWPSEDAKTATDLKTDGPAARQDRHLGARVAFGTGEVTYRQNAIKAAEDTKKKEEAEVTKSADAVAPAEKAVKEKEEAFAKAKGEREAADAAHAGLIKATEASKGRVEVTAKILGRTDFEAAIKEAGPEKVAADKALADATAASEAAKKKVEASTKALADLKAKEEETRKKADEEKKAADAALAEAVKAFDEAKKKADADAKAAGDAKEEEAKKKAEEAKQASEKALAEATKKRDEAKAKADAAGEAQKKAGSPETVAKAEAEKRGSEKAAGETTAAAEAAKGRAEAAARALQVFETGLGLQKAEAGKAPADKALAEVAKPADDAKAALDAATKAAAPLKAKAEAATKAVADAKAKLEAAAKALADAKDDASKKKAEKAEKAAEEANKKAEGDNVAAAQAAEKAEQARAAAEKTAAEAGKKRDEAKAKADAAGAAHAPVKAASDAARKAVEADKTAAETAIKGADAQLQAADKKRQDAKKAEEGAQVALEQSMLNLESSKRRAQKAKDAVAAAAKSIEDSTARHKAQQEEQKGLEAEKKQAAEAITKAQHLIRAAAFAADGVLVALGASDGGVYTFGSEKGDEAAFFAAHGKPVLAVGFSADGRVISVGSDGSVRAGAAIAGWKLKLAIEPRGAEQAPVDRVQALAFSPDGKILASGGGLPSRDGELALWSTADGKAIRTIVGAHSDVVYDVSFSPDGTQLASGAADKFAKVFDVATGKQIRSFEGHTSHVLGVGWNRTGRTLATAGADNVVKVWDATTGQQTKTIPGFEKQVTCLRYLGFDDRFIASAGGSPLRLVRENGTVERNFEGAQGFTYSVSVSGDGRLVAAGGLDGVLRVWRPEATAPVAVFELPAK